MDFIRSIILLMLNSLCLFDVLLFFKNIHFQFDSIMIYLYLLFYYYVSINLIS